MKTVWVPELEQNFWSLNLRAEPLWTLRFALRLSAVRRSHLRDRQIAAVPARYQVSLLHSLSEVVQQHARRLQRQVPQGSKTTQTVMEAEKMSELLVRRLLAEPGSFKID